MTQLDTPSSSGPPAAYFPEVGDAMVVGIVDVGEYQQRDYDTGDLLTWPDGGPRMGKVVTGLVVEARGSACGGGQKAQTPVEPGDLVTFWCEGSKWFTYSEALKAAGGVNLGDVMLWQRDEDEAPKNTRHNPRKVYSARIRRPEAKDGDIVDRCMAKRRELQEHKLDRAPAEEPAPQPVTADF